MADTTAIAWTRSVFNSWVGCTKISPGCDGCYAEALDKRFRLGGATHWGAGVPRYRTSAANWAKPLAWNKAAPTSEFAGRKGFWPVFCGSMCDVFDNDDEVPEEWRRDLWRLIKATPNLSWLLVTKRIGNVRNMVPPLWLTSSTDGFPPNVRIIITVVNQEEAERDIPKLLALPCKNGVSYEPALGLVDWDRFLYLPDRLRWVIVGGESSQPCHPARLFDLAWARSTISQCKAAGVPVFFKQAGSNTINSSDSAGPWPVAPAERLVWADRAGADPSEWPADLRVREWPE